MKNSKEEVTATHAVETGTATGMGKKSRNAIEVVAKRAEALVAWQRAADKAARDASRGLMTPASSKQGNQGDGWFSTTKVEAAIRQVGLANGQGMREPGWASTMTKANDCRGKDRGNNADSNSSEGWPR
jgi:hypothetical protein